VLEFNRPYLLADYVEWLIANDKRTEVSRGDIANEASILEGLDPETTVDPSALNAAEQRQNRAQKRDAQIDDCFDHLEYRARAFGESYIFSIDRDVIKPKRGGAATTDIELVYKFLLACGKSELSKQLSAAFSELCKLAVQRFFGGKANVFNVDAGAADRQIVGTNTRDAARYLAPYLGATPLEHMLEDLAGTGDGGADIAAALGFGDGAGGHFAMLGQCAASSSESYWKDKLQQPGRFRSLYQWTVPPLLAGFIPVVYRTASGGWFSKINVQDSLIFDRLRILNALDILQQPLPNGLRDQIKAALKTALEPAKSPDRRKKKVARKASPASAGNRRPSTRRRTA